MYRDFYNFIASEASWRGSLLRHNELEENNTKTLVCKEKLEGAGGKVEGGIWKGKKERRQAEMWKHGVGFGIRNADVGRRYD